MQKNTIISLIVAGVLVTGAIVMRQNGEESPQVVASISNAQLKEATGKDGKDCWLAVDGVVYEIEQGYKWVDGEHVEASIAYCGADMSDVIDKAPHGRTKLTQLKQVGKLK